MQTTVKNTPGQDLNVAQTELTCFRLNCRIQMCERRRGEERFAENYRQTRHSLQPITFPLSLFDNLPTDFITPCVNMTVGSLADLQQLLQNKYPVHVVYDLCQRQAKVQKDSFPLCPWVHILEIRINGANKPPSPLVGQALLGSRRESWFLGNQSQLKLKQQPWDIVSLSRYWYPWSLWCICMCVCLRIMKICWSHFHFPIIK